MKTINHSVRRVSRISREDIGKIISDIQDFMGEYADPVDEVEEVVRHNMDNAVVFEAVSEAGDRVGLAYLIPIPYAKFQPPFHLAYIAVDPPFRGDGVGKNLVMQVMEFTGGVFSLHVSPKNTDAIMFYESMGLSRRYVRMTP